MQVTFRQLAMPTARAPLWRPTSWPPGAPHTPRPRPTAAAQPSSSSAGATPPAAPDCLNPSSSPTTSATPSATAKPQSQQPQQQQNQRQPSALGGPVSGPAVPPVAAADELADLPFYSQFPLDHRAEWRRDRELLDQLFAREDATLIPLLRDKVLVRPASGGDAAAPGSAAAPLMQPVLLRPAAAYADAVASSPARVFLGTDALGAPYFAAAVASPDDARSLAASPSPSSEAAAQPGAAEWRSARSAGPDLTPTDASLLAVASGLLVWHGANGFSASTGAPSEATAGGFSRRCTGGGGSAYPRIDPAVIMLVSQGDFALLGRKAEWPADRYSTLAGFLEMGEPLEAAVAREVEEEAGVRVDLASVTYAASQPWPFPRSLMIGFHARAAPAPPVTAAGATDAGGGYLPPPVAAAAAAAQRPWWRSAPAPASGFELLSPMGRRAAMDVGIFAEEVEAALGPLHRLPWPAADEEELADVRWFHRDWLRAVFLAPGGPLSVPGARRFNVPGPYSLAHRLITSWVGCSPGGGEAAAAPPPPAAAPPPQTDPWDGDAIPQVLIDGSGTFKYVLARLWDPRVEGGGGDRSKLLVWGDVRAPYHNDILQRAKAAARPLGLTVTPLGGGRIRHDPDAREIQVYGFSAAFGPAPHEVAAAIIHRWFPLYDKESITVSYDGY